MKKTLSLLVISVSLLLVNILSAQTSVNDSLQRTPRVGLVLGGGGAKGAAHIGVLKYMEEIGIPISYVAGTSMGSIIGGLYAMGYPPDELADLIAHMDWNFYMSNNIDRDDLSIEKRKSKSTELISIPFNFGDVQNQRQDLIGSLPSGAVNSSNLLNLFNRLCIGYQDSIPFANMPIPFACIATDLLTGDSVILNKGEFAKAIRSSMSIPGVFAPVEWGNRLLADGGMVNNFPVDVCRNMGADIIIGVEVASKPITNSDSLRSLPQQMMQYLSIATQGNNATFRKQCRIYITPDVTGYNMLSFSTENIDSLVQRGYRQAKLHEAEFLALKAELEKYGPCQKVLQGPRAQKLMSGDKITVGKVSYHGVSQQESRQLYAQHYLVTGQNIDISQLETLVSRLRGSGRYLYAHYKLHQRSVTDNISALNPDSVYDVSIELIPAKPHCFGLGLRYDSEESAEVLFHLGWNEQRTTGLKLFLDLDLAYNFDLNTRLSWATSGAGDINLDYRYHKSTYRILSRGMMESIWHNRFRLYYSNSTSRYIYFEGGIQQDIFINADTRILTNFFDFTDIEIYDSEKALSLFAQFTYDNMDEKFFAHQGTELKTFAALYKRNDYLFNNEYNPFLNLRLSYKTHIPLSKTLCLIPQVAGSAYFGYSNLSEVLWYNNAIGGAYSNRYLDQQLSFIGLNGLLPVGDLLGILRLDLRYQITPKNFISFIANTYTEYVPNNDMDKVQSYQFDHALGLGLRFAHKSILGPISLDLAWSTRSRHLCGFLNIGHYF